jgi:hypothetical protein
MMPQDLRADDEIGAPDLALRDASPLEGALGPHTRAHLADGPQCVVTPDHSAGPRTISAHAEA